MKMVKALAFIVSLLVAASAWAGEPEAVPQYYHVITQRRGLVRPPIVTVVPMGNPAPEPSPVPTNASQVLQAVYDSINSALRINATLSGVAMAGPSNTDQILRAVYDPVNGALKVNCVTGCSGGGGGGANPAGSGSEVQFREDGTTFGAALGSSVDGSGNVTLGSNLNVISNLVLTTRTASPTGSGQIYGLFGVDTNTLSFRDYLLTSTGFMLDVANSSDVGFTNSAGGFEWISNGNTSVMMTFLPGAAPTFKFGNNSGNNNPNTNDGSGILLAGIMSAGTGFKQNGAAPSGHYLRGNGTVYADSTIQAADLPSSLLPAGSGSELQFRASGTTFGGAAGSSVDGSGNIVVNTMAATRFNAITGYRIGGAAPLNHFLRGNGTDYVDGVLQSGDVSCAAMPPLVGDTSSPGGSCSTTTSKINGVAFVGTSGHLTGFGASNIPVDTGIVASQVLPLTTEGDIYYFHSGVPARLALGVNATCIVSNGTDPVWGSCLPNLMTGFGDMMGGGAAGAPTRIAGGKTGQTLGFTSGAVPTAASLGINKGNGGSDVTSANYLALCDSSTSVRDRGSILVFSSGASAPVLPDPTDSGCGVGFTVKLVDKSAGAITVSRETSATFDVYSGSSMLPGVTSFVIGTGQIAGVVADSSTHYSVFLESPVGEGDIGTITWNNGGTSTFAAASNFIAGGVLTTVSGQSSTLSPTGLIKWGAYTLKVVNAASTAATLTLGTGGSCSRWLVKNGGGGDGVVVLSGASVVDLLSFTFDGTNCLAAFGGNFH